ncbi:protein-disulfide reductase DsbD domain-containing protein, partial [Xanthomonas citri pv. citri]
MQRIALLLAMLASAPLALAAYDEPLSAAQAFRPTLSAYDANTLVISFQIPEGYYLYRDRLSILDTQGFQLTSYQIGGTKVIDDPVAGREEVLDAGSRVVVRGMSTGQASGVQLRLKMQG